MVIGIATEFNPFHNGHLFLLQTVREKYPDASCVCVMSGNFVQRGQPAICDKWARAEMALRGGADLVIELPFCFAVRSASYFAAGVLELMNRLEVVTHLLFGSECGQMELLKPIASELSQETSAFKSYLRHYLSSGLNFPSARARALQDYLDTPDLKEILQGPNNILALEYLRILQEKNLPIVPMTIPIKNYLSSGFENKPYPTASAIRNELTSSSPLKYFSQNPLSMPLFSSGIIQREITLGRAPVPPHAFEQAIMIKLRSLKPAELAKINDINEGLEHRIIKAAHSRGNLDTLRKKIKSKRYNMTKINRVLLYVLFSLSKEQIKIFDQIGPGYIRVLAFSPKGQKVLRNIKNCTRLPVISRGQDIKNLTRYDDGPAGQMLALDVRASDYYALAAPRPEARSGRRDYHTAPVQI
ncbi:MAG: nucleotidyltransferase family protein [Syntrophomonadaceae bacterium]|jgi:predicted nucleotidyltransferase|nr:nucleotidyltransferase family protein [Syntrophomonadaceae bacterium]